MGSAGMHECCRLRPLARISRARTGNAFVAATLSEVARSSAKVTRARSLISNAEGAAQSPAEPVDCSFFFGALQLLIVPRPVASLRNVPKDAGWIHNESNAQPPRLHCWRSWRGDAECLD